MLRALLGRYLGRRAMEYGKGAQLWRRVARPSATEWTAYLKRHGGFNRFGEHCHISLDTVFTDPAYTSIGNNVRIAGAWISGHDGSVNMMSRAYGTRLDSVGPVIFEDDVFIGHGAIILPGVRIGPRAIVGAGAVIGRDVPPNSVVAGSPARRIRSLDEHLEIVRQRMDGYPWKDLILQREGGYDPAIEPELKRQRIAHFFGIADRRASGASKIS